MKKGHPPNSARFTLRIAAASFIVLAWGIAWLGSLVPTSHAEEPIRVHVNAHDFAFGQQVRFQLEVESDDPIQSIVLAYRTLDTLGTTVEAMRFDASTSVRLEYVHEIRNRYIRPFIELTYWWTIVNAAGERLSTDPQTFAYVDDRFDWQTLNDGAIQVHWYQGELKVAQQALDISLAGLNRAAQDIGAEAIKSVDIYLYATPEDLQAALPAPLPTGAEALTLYETNVVLVPFGPEGTNIPRLRRVLPHEVTHALLHEVTQSEFDRLPLWLSEGLATSVEYTFVPDPDAQLLLEEAMRARTLIPLNTLCAAFPPPPDLARTRLAYAESASIINFVRDRHGRQTLRDLVAAYADGATCEGGVQRVLKSSLDRLEARWREALAPRSKWIVFWEENGAWVILFVLFTAFPLLFIIPSRTQTPSARPNLS
jgi:hypothetical protein